MSRKELVGTVVSDVNDKTVIVSVIREFEHPSCKKIVRRSKEYHAHDERNEYKIGDFVRIEERAPFSKKKHWEVISGYRTRRSV